MSEDAKKLCFVIGPIGDENSEPRRHADWLLDGIIKPVFDVHFQDYKVERADKITSPGSISSQVITRILDAPLVIADMSLHNTNAFYELAIRHMVFLPTIHMIRKDWTIPFDVAPYRAIPFSYTEYTDIEEAREKLRSTVKEAIQPGFAVENPITHARGIVQVKEHASNEQRVILDELQSLKGHLGQIDGVANLALSMAQAALNTKPREEGPLHRLMTAPLPNATYASIFPMTFPASSKGSSKEPLIKP